MDQLGTLLPLALLAVAFYFLILRPQQKRSKAQASLQSGLQPGMHVMTTAGVYGTIAYVDGDQVGVEVAPGVIIRHLNAAISKVIEDQPSDPSTEASQ